MVDHSSRLNKILAVFLGCALAGGIASSALAANAEAVTDPCSAFSEHGYAGTARDAVKDIAQFIKQT